MSSTYNGVNGAAAPGDTIAITIPDDGDTLTALSSNTPDKTLADRVKSIIEKYVDKATAQTITALKTFSGGVVVSKSSGYAGEFSGGGGGTGVFAEGDGAGAGAEVYGGASGDGLVVVGGGSAKCGVDVSAVAGSRAAARLDGTNSTSTGKKLCADLEDGFVRFFTPPTVAVADDMSNIFSQQQFARAHARFSTNGSGSPTVQGGVHIASVAASTTLITVTFAAALPSALFTCLVVAGGLNAAPFKVVKVASTTTTVTIAIFNDDGTVQLDPSDPAQSGVTIDVVVFGG